ncbi:hypothetical protein GQ53DRAFT_719109 [Thozetella sp. PMI_491]|nr:hypothetical protein GQ53DRAFT_719109 [Thozetella sp. PMI_491]
MTPTQHERDYDIILLGATGFTGALTAEHITQHFPADLRWAIAGRSEAKLKALSEKLRKLDPNREQPKVEIVSLDERAQVLEVVKKAKVCISVVLYFLVGEVVMDACIEAGTDYVDTNGGTQSVRSLIPKYHKAAEDAGVAVILAAGAMSAPQDLITWALVQELERASSFKTKEVVLSIKEIPMDPSGGTMEAITDELAKPNKKADTAYEAPWILSPLKGKHPYAKTNRLGMRHDPKLGSLSATSVGAAQNQAFINRTWALLDSGKYYGENFQYHEYESASTISGATRGIRNGLTNRALSIGPVRNLLRKAFPAPGEGPLRDGERRVEIEAVGIADGQKDGAEPPRVYASFAYPFGGTYHLTALFLAQAAASLLYTRSLLGQTKGGLLTPAFLAPDLVERAKSAGVELAVAMLHS